MAKTKRISFRVDEVVKMRIHDSAVKEERSEAEFSRLVFEWALDQYLRAGDLLQLRKLQVYGNKAPQYLAKRA